MSRRRENLKEVETSPDGRYIRFDERLGTGAYKEVYLCYDTETGKEVAWNTVDLQRLPTDEKKRIRGETEILKELEHPHIINFFTVWENPDKEQICFTTEIVTSGTLKQYISRVKGIKLKVIKKWCRQILNGLDYLHSHNPPIIHRDLKCDNIFINGSTGEIRIGDFGLSSYRHKTHAESVLGTPEFMAPELYEENYGEKVDIYAFGMSVLEMATKEYPYEECSNAAQIWKRVSTGQKPEVLDRIKEKEVHDFVEMCLLPVHIRPTARELLKHPFLAFKSSDPYLDFKVITVKPRESHNTTAAAAVNHTADADNPKQTASPPSATAASVTVSAAANTGFNIPSPSPSPNSSSVNANVPSSVAKKPALSHTTSIPSSSPPQASATSSKFIVTCSTATPLPSPTTRTATTNTLTPTLATPAVLPIQQVSLPAHAVPSSSYTSPPSGSISNPTSSNGSNVSAAPVVLSGHNRLQSSPNLSHLLSSVNNVSPTPPATTTPTAASVDTQQSITNIVVDVELIQNFVAQIVLHIHFDTKKKKQVKFCFDFRHDTYQSIAGEMVKALKLPDPPRTIYVIAETLEHKLDGERKKFLQHLHTSSMPLPSSSSTSSVTSLPFANPQQLQHHHAQQQLHHQHPPANHHQQHPHQHQQQLQPPL